MMEKELQSLFELKEPPHQIDDLDFIYDHLFTLGVPYDSPPEFRKYVFAAAKAYYWGNHSIDSTLKRYGSVWNFEDEPTPRDKRFRKISRLIKELFRNNEKRINSIENKPDRVGLFAAGAAIIKLSSSFRSTLILSRLGFFFEACCICRFTLEQLAWAYSVFGIADTSLFKTSVTKSVTKLKKLIPYSGRLYGLLTPLAHLSPEYTKEYISFDGEDPAIIVATQGNLDIILHVLLLLIDICLVVSEVIYLPLLQEYHYVRIDDKNRIILKKDRPLVPIVEDFRNKYIKQEPNHSME